MKKLFLFVAAAAMIFAAGTAQAAKKLPPKVIVGFETDQEFKDIFKENNGNKDYPVDSRELLLLIANIFNRPVPAPSLAKDAAHHHPCRNATPAQGSRYHLEKKG